MEQTGKILIAVGALLLLAGIIFLLFGNKFSWIGNLPGDIKIEKENFKLYFPITTMILFSIALSLVLWLIRKIG